MWYLEKTSFIFFLLNIRFYLCVWGRNLIPQNPLSPSNSLHTHTKGGKKKIVIVCNYATMLYRTNTINTWVPLLSERNEILRNILDIESQLRAMKKNPDYVTTKRNLKYLEEKRFGSKLVTVASPEDYSVNLSVKRRSVEFQDIILRYKEKQTELNERMNVLASRRKRLINQLFPG